MALPPPLARLFTPHRAFDGDSTPLRVALVVVSFVAIANALSFSLAAAPVAAAVDGTVSIDNPNRPSDFACDANTDDFVEWNDETPESCTLPERVERPLGGYARSAVTGLALPASLAVGCGWLLSVAWLFAFSGGDENGSLAVLIGDSAWATVPLLLPAVLRPLLLRTTAESYEYGGTIESVETTASVVASGASMEPLFAVSALAVLWSGGILAAILQRRRGVARTAAGAIAAVPVGAILLASSSQTPTADPGLFAAGGVLVAFGLPYALFPVGLIELSARFELVGFRGDVEPEDWYVDLHRFGGLLAACVGFLLTASPTILV